MSETRREITLSTDEMREIALTLNDTTLNREKVSVNQIREILRAVSRDTGGRTERDRRDTERLAPISTEDGIE